MKMSCPKHDFGALAKIEGNYITMEKVTINGKEYSIDIEKCKEQGLLVEEKKYPKNWKEFGEILSKEGHYEYRDWGILYNDDEQKAFIALGKLIQLRDWWWDNMCDGWRPDWTNGKTKYVFYLNLENNFSSTWLNSQHILAFPDLKIGDKFFETYRDLIEEAKMFMATCPYDTLIITIHRSHNDDRIYHMECTGKDSVTPELDEQLFSGLEFKN